MKNIGKQKVSNMDILYSFFLLGLTSFGGPVAHIGYFRNVFVKQKKWLDEKTYIDFVSFVETELIAELNRLDLEFSKVFLP